jgi:uncharacterized protein with PIN domain
VDVLTVAEVGMLGASDEEHLALARREERVLFTRDADFLRLHAAGVRHAGIVYAHRQEPIGEMIRALVLVREVLEPNEKDNIEFV